MPDHSPEHPEGTEMRRMLSAPLRIDEYRPLSATVHVEFGTISHAGRHRSGNEDHYLTMRLGRHQEVLATSLASDDVPARFDEYGYAMLVADGIGRSGSGGLASRIALSTIAHLAIHFGNWSLRIDAETAESVMDRVVWFYERAARAVDRESEASSTLAGMATSLTAVFSAGDELMYAHAGSSRAYLFRAGELRQFTQDHTVDRELAEYGGPIGLPPDGPQRLSQMLTEVVGGGRSVATVDVGRLRIMDQDIILLCTQGLWRMLDAITIADVLSQVRHPRDQCRRLAELANGTNPDDVTAVVAKFSIPAVSR